MKTERFQNGILLDWGMFAAGIAATWVMGWSTKDLLWGMWTTSLVSGVVFYSRGILRNKSFTTPVAAVFSGLALVFGLAFFLLHFGAFHYVYALILDLLIPIEPDPGRIYIGNLTWTNVREFSVMRTITVGLVQYWPLVLATVVHQLFSPAPNLKSESESFRPYMFVLKMHFLMFALGALYAIGLESFPVYIVVLLFFFMPSSLKMLFSRKNEPEAAES